jgi:hypothetical protein
MEGMEATSSVTPETSSDSSEGTQDSSESQGTEFGNAQSKPAPKAKAPVVDDDMEEIALGSVKGKIPRAMAKAIKEYERGFHSKAQEAAKLKRDLDGYEKADVREILKRKNIDAYEFSEATLAEKLEMLQMSPEQKRLREYEAKLKGYEEQEKRAKDEAEKVELTRREQHAQGELDKEVGKAFQDSGLPKHPYFIQQIAAVMLAAGKQGFDLSAEAAAVKVKERFNAHLQQVLESLDDDGLQKYLGDRNLKRLREAEIRRVTGNTAPTANSTQRPGDAKPSATRVNQPKKPMNEREYREHIAKL